MLIDHCPEFNVTSFQFERRDLCIPMPPQPMPSIKNDISLELAILLGLKPSTEELQPKPSAP